MRAAYSHHGFGPLSIFLFLSYCGFFTPIARATTATAATLTVTPSTSIAAQQIATLTAAVQAGGKPVSVGTVAFYDGKLYLGSAQVVRDASRGYTVGTATLKAAFSVGTHSLVAMFLPTATLSSSSSSTQMLTVTGTSTTGLMLTSAAASGSSTQFTATLFASAGNTPTGSILFSNQTSSGQLGTMDIDPKAFTPASSIPPPLSASMPEAVYPVDLNGDGYPDLLINQNPNLRGGELVDRLSGGDGTFGAENSIGFLYGFYGPIVIADYNGDGVPDLAFTSSDNLFISTYDAMSVLLGAGDGSFPMGSTLLGPSATGSLSLGFVATGDFDGDGIPDLTVTDLTNPAAPTLYIFPGNGDGTFKTPVTSPGPAGITSLVVADFNQDGFADIAVTLSNQNAVLVMIGKGDGTFLPPVSYTTGGTPLIEATLQSRGNGITDLAVLNTADGTLGVILGNGDGTFLPQVTYSSLSPAGETPIQAVAAGVTGDRQQDIVVLSDTTPNANPSGSSFAILAGNGDGTYQPPFQNVIPPANASFSIAPADLNRDGISDLVGAGNEQIVTNLSGLQEAIQFTTPVYGMGAQTIVAKYSGDSNFMSSTSNSIMVTGQGPPPTPTFTLSANPSSLMIVSGQTGTATLTVTPQNGFNSAVKFSCSGLPANSSCSFSPASVTPNGAAVSTSLTLATNVQFAASHFSENPFGGAFLSFTLLLGLNSFTGIRLARRGSASYSTSEKSWLCLFLAAAPALAVGLCLGCGGGSSTPPPKPPTTPPGTSMVTVTAVGPGSPGMSATSVLTLTVTQ